MNELINFERRLIKKPFKGLNAEFTELVDLIEDQEDALSDPFTLADFFQLFYDFLEQIPLEGNPYSLRVMLDVISDKLGIYPQEETDISALLEEITSLRSQLLESNTILNDSLNNNYGITSDLQVSIDDTKKAIDLANQTSEL